MLPTIGPWCDTERFTDTRLLVALAQESREVALGVMINRNLTGEDLANVATRAALTAANISHLGAAYLMVGRSVEDQVAVVLATLRRSPAAAEQLLEYLVPLSALRLHQIATTTRVRGGARLARELGRTVASHLFIRYTGEPGFAEAVRTVVGEESEILLAGEALLAFGDRDALNALTPRIAAAEEEKRDSDDTLLEALLLATYGVPEVVTHWSREGGVLGVQVAATDHRQTPELLISLRGPGVRKLLTSNPTVPAHWTAKYLAKKFARAMEKTPAIVAGWALGSVESKARSWVADRERFDKLRLDDLAQTKSKHIEALINHTGYTPMTKLLTYELLVHANPNKLARQQLLRSLLRERTWYGFYSDVARDVVERVGPDELGHVLAARLHRVLPDVIDRREPEIDEDITLRFLSDRKARKFDGRGEISFPAASEVAAHLDAPAQYVALYAEYRAAGSRSGALDTLDAPLAEVLRRIADTVPGAAAAAPDALADLIPSGLGDL